MLRGCTPGIKGSINTCSLWDNFWRILSKCFVNATSCFCGKCSEETGHGLARRKPRSNPWTDMATLDTVDYLTLSAQVLSPRTPDPGNPKNKSRYPDSLKTLQSCGFTWGLSGTDHPFRELRHLRAALFMFMRETVQPHMFQCKFSSWNLREFSKKQPTPSPDAFAQFYAVKTFGWTVLLCDIP